MKRLLEQRKNKKKKGEWPFLSAESRQLSPLRGPMSSGAFDLQVARWSASTPTAPATGNGGALGGRGIPTRGGKWCRESLKRDSCRGIGWYRCSIELRCTIRFVFGVCATGERRGR